MSYSAMSGANLEAVDRVVRIVRELDRYHGFPGREVRAQDHNPLRRRSRLRSRFSRQSAGRPEMLPQALEKVRFAAENVSPLHASFGCQQAAQYEFFGGGLSASSTNLRTTLRTRYTMTSAGPEDGEFMRRP